MRSVFAACVAFLIAMPASSALAAGEPRMQVDPALGRMARGGVWTPIVVELENPGPAMEGFVIVQFGEGGASKGTAREPVELPTGAKKRVTVYARPRTGPQRLEVTLEDARGRVRAGPEALDIDAVGDDTVFVGVVSMGGRGDPGLRSLMDRETLVLPLDVEQLPDAWSAYDVFDALVLRDPDAARLGPARIEALKSWVASGGVLAVSGGEKWRAMDEPAFTELLPVRIKGVRTVAGSDLPYPWALHAGNLVMTVGSPLRGETRVSSVDGDPIISEGRYGLGRVVYLAADPGDLAGVSPDEKAVLWASILQLPPHVVEDPNNPGNYGYANNTPEQLIQQELSRIPPLKPPSVVLVTLLIGLYVLVVGPGDYFLLKRLGKLHWTWVTYPAAIVAFSGLIYLYAKVTRSSDMMLRTIALVDSPAEPPGAPGPVRVFGGVYSPRAGRYTVDVKEPNALAGGFADSSQYGMGGQSSNEYMTTGGTRRKLMLSIPIWSMAGVDLTSHSTEPAPFLVESLPNGAVRVTNTGNAPLEYVGLLVDRKVVDGGKLEPGKDVRLAPTQTGKPISEVPNEMSSQQFGNYKPGAEDLPRLARIFAYATDPPYSTGPSDPYWLPRKKRRLQRMERPRADHGSPVVFAIARAGELPISLSEANQSGSGLVVWRRPIAESPSSSERGVVP